MERTNSRRRKVGVPSLDASSAQSSLKHLASLGSDKSRTTKQTSAWSLYILSSLVVLILTTAFLVTSAGSFGHLLGRFDKDVWSIATTGVGVGQEDISIILRPEDHIYRQPKTLTFDWHVTKGFRSPDGVRKEVYLINGCFPGDTIEARSGDRVVVNVTNLLRNEGLAIHWHGLRLQGANDMDGAVGLTQKPIPSGAGFLYNFTIGEDEFGTFWYHGHEKTQRDDGLYGGLVVHRPVENCNEREALGYDQELLLLIGDWYHRPSTEVLAWYMNSRSFGNEPVPDSLLVNGKGNFDCAMAVPARPVECVPQDERDQLPTLHLESGKRYRVRLVNTGSLTGYSFALDRGSLTPFQLDGGHQIDMVEAESVGILYPGERVDAMLQVAGPGDRAKLKVEMDDEHSKYPNPALNPTQVFPVVVAQNYESQLPFPETIHEHFNLQAASSNATHSGLSGNCPLKFVVYTTTMKLARHHNIPMGFINHTSWSPQAEPLIGLSRTNYDRNQLSPHIPLALKNGSSGTDSGGWVEIVINNLDDGGHPFHLHGYSFYVVSVFPAPVAWSSERPPFTPGGSAMYNYNPFTTEPSESPGGEYNLLNPLVKDTVFIPQRGYAVIRFRADNEGIWMMHCHVGWHLGSGMAMSWDVN
ncbi:hypothetical protein H2200_011529 [Cladophialophora chaetospira]|uniref:Multicopper oxidase n=1 Tax=Cladophialophora chaetospira TaxID=386627 RepID=A0AA38WZK7_9EURO|nr:hypothetical protein H2200_011529 [Cladophialophora chaetospira]